MSDFAIGDISGYKKEFEALVSGVTDVYRIIAMGDIIDRGPESAQLVEFFINNPQHISLMGNHEHMFIKVYDQVMHAKESPYYSLLWIYVNGGRQTLESYGLEIPEFHLPYSEIKRMSNSEKKELLSSSVAKNIFAQFDLIPKEHIDFLKQLPLTIETDQAFFSHAPVVDWKNPKLFDYQKIDTSDRLLDLGPLWNRQDPKRARKDNKLVVYGHQNKNKVLAHNDKHPMGVYVPADQLTAPKGTWGICIDTVKSGFLTGLKLKDMTLHYQKLFDSK